MLRLTTSTSEMPPTLLSGYRIAQWSESLQCQFHRSASRRNRLTFEPGDLCLFWRDGLGCSPGMATVVSQVGQGHYYVDCGGRIFKQSAEQLLHVTERERPRRLCENPRTPVETLIM